MHETLGLQEFCQPFYPIRKDWKIWFICSFFKASFLFGYLIPENSISFKRLCGSALAQNEHLLAIFSILEHNLAIRVLSGHFLMALLSSIQLYSIESGKFFLKNFNWKTNWRSFENYKRSLLIEWGKRSLKPQLS